MISPPSWFVAPLAALILTACPSNPPTKGKIDGGSYASPHGNYTMQIPLGPGLGRRITDDAREVQGKEGYVSILNDFGEVRSVEYVEIPAAETQRFAGDNLPYSLQSGYREGFVASKLEQFPGTRSLHDEPLENADGRAHFGIVFIPGGSPLVRANALGLPSNEHLDTLRSYLVFARDGFLYILGCTFSADGIEPDLTLTPERIDAYKRSLDAMRAGMSFPPPR